MLLPFLETMIVQACNLSCLGCTNYSDLKHSGYVSWEQGKKDLVLWQNRLDIKEFGIIGGEPLLNPEWKNWLFGCREIFPNARLRFTTNGLLLNRVPDIVDVCEQVGNMVFKITIHVKNKMLENSVEQIKNSRCWTPVIEHGIHRWAGPNNIRLQINRPDRFLKTYKNSYENMAPWNSDPSQSFKLCCQQTCPLLYNGRIYKCSTAGLLKDTLKKLNYPNLNDWVPYLTNGISVTDSDEIIKDFCENFGNPHQICGQCPSNKDDSVDHYQTVTFKSRRSMLSYD